MTAALPTAAKRAVWWMCAGAAALALGGLLLGRHRDFGSESGALVFGGTDDSPFGGLLALNQLGALVYLALIVATAAVAWLGQRKIIIGVAGVWALLALSVPAIWRNGDGGPLGASRGSNLALCLAMALGLAAIALWYPADDATASSDRSTSS
jgi:hypothetical protein